MPVRYVFMMMLAIADQAGDVIGTDVAIARRINVPLAEFQGCVDALMQPDPDSNSQENEGRRIVNSEGSRGYHLVNYLLYRGLKTVEDRREYMRKYMEERRRKQGVKPRKHLLAKLTHAEAEEKADADEGGKSGDLPLKNKARGSLEEIVTYVTEFGKLLVTDGEWFYDKMLSSGWKNDGKDVKDWKATVRMWKSINIFPSQKSNGSAPHRNGHATKPPVPDIRLGIDRDDFRQWLFTTYPRAKSDLTLETVPAEKIAEYRQQRKS